MQTQDADLDFSPLVRASVPHLLVELAETHSNIANLCLRIGFLRQEELRGVSHAKEQRIEYEAVQAAYVEKKWLLVKILEYGHAATVQ